MGFLSFIFYFIIAMTIALIQIIFILWINDWGNKPLSTQSKPIYPQTLALLACVIFILTLIKSYMSSSLFITCVNYIHYRIIYHLLRAPAKLLDYEFSRKLLLCLKNDINILDTIAPINYNALTTIGISVISSIFLVLFLNLWLGIPFSYFCSL